MAEETNKIVVVRALRKCQGLRQKKSRQTIFIFNLVFNLRYKRFTSTSRIYLDISEIGVKLLWHVCAQAGSWSLLLFVTDDLVPANVRIISTKLFVEEAKEDIICGISFLVLGDKHWSWGKDQFQIKVYLSLMLSIYKLKSNFFQFAICKSQPFPDVVDFQTHPR